MMDCTTIQTIRLGSRRPEFWPADNPSMPRLATPSPPEQRNAEHIHTYRLSDLSLWNVAAAGLRLMT